ncbi:MAG: tetratricopeptide repeat protein [SAR324 cluster bacterium]|nr:tetratricopeptide repeat protein [SAR324 cluster bacterium]
MRLKRFGLTLLCLGLTGMFFGTFYAAEPESSVVTAEMPDRPSILPDSAMDIPAEMPVVPEAPATTAVPVTSTAPSKAAESTVVPPAPVKAGNASAPTMPVQEQPRRPEPRNTNEIISAPFEQLKKLYGKPEWTTPEQPAEVDQKPKQPEVVETKTKSPIEEMDLPSLSEQQETERNLEFKLETALKELLLDKYVQVKVIVHYIVTTVPITESNKQISQMRLPGFKNQVWVPIDQKKVTGLVHRLTRYNSIFVVVNQPVSPFDLEVLRQKLNAKIAEIDLETNDFLKVAYVPLAEMPGTEKPMASQPETQSEATDPVEKMPEPEITPEPPKLVSANEQRDVEVKSAKQLLEARTAFFRNDLKEALDKINKAIEMNPDSAQGYAMLGSVYYRLKWYGQAKKHWKKSLELEPDNPLIAQYLERLENE